MPKRSRGAMFPLLSGPASEGLSLRNQIYKSCLAAIVDGRLEDGARLPSARQLALDWRISRNTVDDAIARLQAEGFVVRRVGAGTFVAARGARVAPSARVQRRRPSVLGRKALAAVSTWGRSATSSYFSGSVPKAVAFLAGMPALDAFPMLLWRRLVARRLRVGGGGLLGYFPSLGYAPLREATARHLASARGIDCDPGQVMILNSSMQAVDLVARVLLESSDTVWIEDPCFPNLRAALAMSGARIEPVLVDAHGLDVDEGARRAPPALIYVTPSCQYPTGVTMSLERRLALLRHAAATGAWIVEDDYQSEFTYAGRPLVSIHGLDRSERTLYVGTFTNSVFPSLRIAYVVLPQSLVAVFEAVRRQLDDHTHGAMQAVLADFIDSGHFSAHLRKMRALYHGRRDALLAAGARSLPATAVLGPATSGMNLALHLPARQADRAVAARAAASGLSVLPLSRYASGTHPRNGLLLGYAALTERQIGAGMTRLAQVLARGG